MSISDYAKMLKDLKPQKEFFVGIDSDGCAFDTMGIKQRECFCPWLIGYFGLQPVAEAARQCKDFADLFSKTRGANRHKTSKRIISELLPAHPMVKQRGFQVPDFPAGPVYGTTWHCFLLRPWGWCGPWRKYLRVV